MTKKSTDLTKKKDELELVEGIPAGAIVPSTGSGRGFDEMDADDYIVPYVKMMQPLSPEIDEDDPKFVETAGKGDLLNSLSGYNYGDKLKFIPIMFKKRRIYWKDRSDGGGIICGSMNSKQPDMGDMIADSCRRCPKSKWTKDDKENSVPPACTLIYTFPAVVLGLSAKDIGNKIVAVSFMNTSSNAGKELANMAKFSGGDIFARPYLLETKKEKNDKGTYYVLTTKLAGLLTAEEYADAEKVWDMLKDMTIDFQDDKHTKDEMTEDTGIDGNPVEVF
jgi:hypothetical protein